MLRALVLTLNDSVGGQVCDAYCGVCRVDVLTACSRRTICIDAKILIQDFNFNVLVNLGIEKESAKEIMVVCCLIKWREGHEPMNAGFGWEQAVSVFAFNS